MFKELLEVFKKGNLIEQAFKLSLYMLKEDREIFDSAREVLRNQDGSELSFDISARDNEINNYQREVRKKILAHLAISGTSDLTTGLVLQRTVNDIERIGDYNKNIVYLAKRYPQKLEGVMFEEKLIEVENNIKTMFCELIACFESSDAVKAQEIVNIHKTNSQFCIEGAETILKDNNLNLESNQAACLIMYFRYLKRISSHMKRIAKSIVEPFAEE